MFLVKKVWGMELHFIKGKWGDYDLIKAKNMFQKERTRGFIAESICRFSIVNMYSTELTHAF